jgi:hypothetical protein
MSDRRNFFRVAACALAAVAVNMLPARAALTLSEEGKLRREKIRRLLQHLRRRQQNEKTAKRQQQQLIKFWQQIALLHTPQQRVAFWRKWYKEGR